MGSESSVDAPSLVAAVPGGGKRVVGDGCQKCGTEIGGGFVHLGRVDRLSEALNRLGIELSGGLRRRAPWLTLAVDLARIDGYEILDFVRAQGRDCGERFFYRSRDGDAVGGVGFAVRAETLHDVDDAAVRTAGVRVYVASRFDPSATPSTRWSAFGEEGLVFVPSLEIRSDGSVRVNIYRFDQEASIRAATLLQDSVGRYASDVAARGARCILAGAKLGTSQQMWNRSMQSIKDLFQARKVLKIVMARTLEIAYRTQAPDPFACLFELDKLSPNAFLFGVQPCSRTAFVGCSPERLFYVDSEALHTEALAGTRRVVNGCHEDAVNALRGSKKDCYEQGLVTSYIVSALKECGASKIELFDDVVRQPHLVHLRTQIAAVLAGGSVMRNVDQLLRVLNPTPAVCGLPTADARTRLADLEQADRGLYAGPLGFVDASSSEFCVAIRSALFTDSSVTIYGGAGIVPDSDALEEWKETALKMAPFVRVLAGLDCEGAVQLAMTGSLACTD